MRGCLETLLVVALVAIAGAIVVTLVYALAVAVAAVTGGLS